MTVNALRNELIPLLQSPPDRRKPVIRRSLRSEWLYWTDLPVLWDGPVPETLLKGLSDAGWEYELKDRSWLELRKDCRTPPDNWYQGPFGPEAGCCGSLLKRHPRSCRSESDSAALLLIKAGETGYSAYEEACAVLHREWAGRLRKHQALPDMDLCYFES